VDREGRTWDWYRPLQNVQLDSTIETKPLNWGRFGLGILYLLQASSIFGVFVMRRRKLPVTPLAALIVNVVISTAITFGQSRYRASAEIAFVLMGTAGFVGLAEIVKRWRQRGLPPADDAAALDAPLGPDRATV
jgi:hypothetical protein